MKFTLEIDLENAAFEGDFDDMRDAYEIARILVKLARSLEDRGEVGTDARPLRDVNGNTCGHWQIS